jgi:hypothetical protein
MLADTGCLAEMVEAADDACELMEMTGLHGESAYQRLKEMVRRLTPNA